MSMIEWAEKEVELACKREAPDRNDGEWDYGCTCYESALKAYKSLCEDGHSGTSFWFTKNILVKLMNGDPLTPIEDTDDIWNECGADTREHFTVYQCKRKSSLFKDIYDDGHIEYSDVERFLCYNPDDPHKTHFYNGFVARIANEYRPIIFPYYPDNANKYKIQVIESLYRYDGHDDYDMLAILGMENLARTEYVPINRYYISEEGQELTEISEQEYKDRIKNAYMPNLYATEEEK